MSTTILSRASAAQPYGAREDRPAKRKKEQRADIWSGLLRQTREAQARNRTQTAQRRQLLVCGGSSEDQNAFLQSLSRPPPPQPASRNQDRRQQWPKGQWKLSNKYAYGYGHVTLFSPPQHSSAGVQALGSEAEEAASLEVHTITDPAVQYVDVLRRILERKESTKDTEDDTTEPSYPEELAPISHQQTQGICILLSWKEPWRFMSTLQRWLQILAKALLAPDKQVTDPLDVLKDAQISLTVIVQHTESQEVLFREGYKEEDFDHISQCLRTAILPLHPSSALVYMSSTAPPQQPGSPLSETQKVVYTSLGLDLSALNPRTSQTGDSLKREELVPKHEFMDRMAIVIPAGWDSVAFIRTLSETFSPEDTLDAWLADLQPSMEEVSQQTLQDEVSEADENKEDKVSEADENKEDKVAKNDTEVYANSPIIESAEDSLTEPMSPSKASPSAIRTYESKIQDPQAHKASRPPQIEVTTKQDQKFLGEMKAHLQELEAQDRERDATRGSSVVSNTSLSGSRSVGLPTGEQSGALNELGDVSFNVGGVSYDSVSAEAAIERLKRPQPPSSSALDSSASGTRTSTPRPQRHNKDGSAIGKAADSTPNAQTPTGRAALGLPGSVSSASTKSSTDSKDLPIDKLEEYFQSLMKKGGGLPGSSREGTPTRSKGK